MSAVLSSIIRHGNGNYYLLPFNFHFRFQFRFRFHPQFVCPNFCVFSSISANYRLRRNDSVEDPQLFLQSVRDQCKLGFRSVDIPVKLFHQLYSFRPRPSLILFNQLFTAMSKIKPHPPFSTIIAFSNQLELSGLRPNFYSVGILANCYCRLGQVDLGFSLLGKRLKLGYPPDVGIINTLLHGLIASNNLYPAIKFLDKIVKLEIQPTLVTHGTMFKGLCCIGDNAGAVKLLRDRERQSPFKPDVVIYSTLIDSHYRDWLLPQAVDLFKEMKGKGISPNVVTYTSLIRGLCSLGRGDDSKASWTEMLDSNIAPDVNTYNTLIDMYCKEGNVDKARAIFYSMANRGLQPDVITYTALLDGYCLCGEMEEAENLVDLMVKSGTLPNVVTFNSLLNGYCKAKQIDKALVTFKDMCIKGTYVAPDVFTYNTLLDALCKDNRLQLALLLFENMKHRGIVPDVVTYSTLLDGLLKHAQFDRAISMRWEMENDGVAPDHFTCSIIINGLYEVGRLTEAIEMFSHLVARGLRPSVTTYTIMIKVLCRQGLCGDATALLKKMEENECTPNECTYNTIIKGFLNANDVVKALEYLVMMRSQGFAADNKAVFLFLDVLTNRRVSDKDKALLQKYFFEYHGMLSFAI